MDLQTAASELGVHYQTAYRWVREGSLVAVKRGNTYDIAEQDLEAFRSKRLAPAPPPERAAVRDWDHQVDRLYAFLLDGDETGTRTVVDRLVSGGTDVIDLCDRLFAPALRRVGDAWASGEISVAEEHRASAICERMLARLSIHPRGRPRGVAVVATASGEQHSLPAAMATAVLRSDRWQVHHLGTQVPTDDLIDLVRALDADLVVLSTAYPSACAQTAAVAAQVRRQTRAAVLAGSPGDSLRQLVEEAKGLSKLAVEPVEDDPVAFDPVTGCA